MKAIATDGGETILNYGEEISSEVLNIAKHPCIAGRVFVFQNGGLVFATGEAIIPSALGEDIGCTVSAYKTNVKASDISPNVLEDMRCEIIHGGIPMGNKIHEYPQDARFFDDPELWTDTIVTYRLLDDLRFQIGTLGKGNHCIEFLKDDEDNLWYLVHSGSGCLGKKVSSYYVEEANKLCLAFKQDEVVKNNLAFIPKSHELYSLFIKEMYACMNFASDSHDIMCDIIFDTIQNHFPDLVMEDSLSTIHNFVREENDKVIHLKDAIYAGTERRAIIHGPCSYIVQGLGNEMTYKSAPSESQEPLTESDFVKPLTKLQPITKS